MPNLLTAMLGAQEYQAEAGDDDEESQLEVLPALKKVIPCPEVLSDGHGNELDEGEAEEETAEIGAELRTVREGETPGPDEDRVPSRHTALY